MIVKLKFVDKAENVIINAKSFNKTLSYNINNDILFI